MRLLSFLCVFLAISLVSSTNRIISKDSDDEDDEAQYFTQEMKEFISYVVEKYSSERNGFVVITVNEEHQEYVDFVLEKIRKQNATAMVYSMMHPNFEFITLNERHVKIIVLNPYKEIDSLANYYTQVKMSRAKMLVVSTRDPGQTFSTIMFINFDQSRCLNVLIVYTEERQLRVITYNPYQPRHFIVNLTDVIYTKDVYYDKLNNLYGHEINALYTTFDRTKVRARHEGHNLIFSGKDYEVVKTIFEHVNATLKVLNVQNFLNETEYNPFANSNLQQNRTAIKKRIVDVGSVSILLQSEPFTGADGVFEDVYPHTQDDVVVVVLKGQELSWSYQILHCYTPPAIALYFFVEFATLIVLIVVPQLRGEEFDTVVFLESFRNTFLGTFTRLPKTTVERLIMLGLILFCFLTNLNFQSKITSMLMTKAYEKDIDTIEQLYESGMRIYGFENLVSEIKKKYEGTDYGIVNNLKRLPEIALPFDDYRDLVYELDLEHMEFQPVLANYDRAVFATRVRKYRKNGRPILHLMGESLMPSFQSFKVSFGSPYLPLVDELIRRLQEAGLIKLWSDRTLYEATIEGLLYPSEDYDDADHSPQRLTLERLCAAFWVLIAGYVSSFLVFLGEVACHWYSTRKKTHELVFLH